MNASNTCGISSVRKLSVRSKSATPSTIIGATFVCSYDMGVSYLIGTQNNGSYIWSVPAGVTIVSGQGTPNIIVNWGSTSGIVSVLVGNGSPKTLSVTVGSCLRSGLGATLKTELKLYPNPASSNFTVLFNAETIADFEISIRDIIGKVLRTEKFTGIEGANSKYIHSENLARGIYILTLSGGGKNKSIKFTID